MVNKNTIEYIFSATISSIFNYIFICMFSTINPGRVDMNTPQMIMVSIIAGMFILPGIFSLFIGIPILSLVWLFLYLGTF